MISGSSSYFYIPAGLYSQGKSVSAEERDERNISDTFLPEGNEGNTGLVEGGNYLSVVDNSAFASWISVLSVDRNKGMSDLTCFKMIYFKSMK